MNLVLNLLFVQSIRQLGFYLLAGVEYDGVGLESMQLPILQDLADQAGPVVRGAIDNTDRVVHGQTDGLRGADEAIDIVGVHY